MKKLLAGGETRIFALARVFRNRERTALHAPEFTMLEWYRVGEGQEALMPIAPPCCGWRRRRRGATRLRFRGRGGGSVRRAGAAQRARGVSALCGVDVRQSPPLARRARTARDRGPPDPPRSEARRAAPPARDALRVAADDSWSDLFRRLLSEKVEPNLGLGRPTFLTDYPASEAALARLSPHDPRVAERFELYACGVELANAFGELTDPDEQRRRFERGHGAEAADLWGKLSHRRGLPAPACPT